LIHLRAAVFALKLSAEDTHEDSHVEINRETQQRLYVTTVAIRMTFDAPKKDSQSHLMASLGLQWN
jgi:hypothetical protein